LMGVRAIILDLGISPAADRRLKAVLVALGAVIVAYAVWLTGRVVLRA